MDARSKALKAHRARLKKRGMKRLEVCVPAREAAVIRKAASVLREQSARAGELRQVLGFTGNSNRSANAADLFAMAEPLSSAGEALWHDAMAQIERDRKSPRLSSLRKLAV